MRLVPSVDLDRALVARGKLIDFVRMAWAHIDPSPYVDAWHIEEICEHLEAVSRGECRKLLINIVPGHSKTSVVSILWPAWDWIKHPERKYIAASYDAKLALRSARTMRDLVRGPWFQERWGGLGGVEITRAQSAAIGAFKNNCGGFRLSTSTGAGVLGWHADVQVVDDPHSAKELTGALSSVQQHLEKARVWWQETMTTRAVNRSTLARVVVMQRLHERDLSSVCLAEGGYTHLCLPLHYREYRCKQFSLPSRTPWGGDRRTVVGELLCEERIPETEAVTMRTTMGSAVADAQLEQCPASAAGALVKRRWLDQFWTELPKGGQFIQSWDCTFKDAATSDYVVGQVWYSKGGRYYLVDQVRERMNVTATAVAIKTLAHKWPKARGKLVEDKANGPAVVDMLRREVAGLILVNPEGGKMSRLNAVVPLFEAGNVYLPDPATHPWVHDWIEELATFPGAPHDDQVDACSQALLRLHVATSRLGEAMANARDMKLTP